MFFNWCKKRLNTDFTWQGLIVRIIIDLFLSNLGLFLGVLTTVGLYIFTADATPQAFFQKMFFLFGLLMFQYLQSVAFSPIQ